MGMMKIPMIVHEPDFMIHGVLKMNIFGKELWITDTTIGSWIITAVLLLIGVYARGKLKTATASDVPGAFQSALEMGLEALENMAQGILGGNARKFVNYIGTIFLFILFCNLSGLFGLRAPTADYGVTFLLGMFTFFIVNYQGLKNRGVGHFTSLFQPLCTGIHDAFPQNTHLPVPLPRQGHPFVLFLTQLPMAAFSQCINCYFYR